MSFEEGTLISEMIAFVEKPELRFVSQVERKIKKKKDANREGGRGLISALMAEDGLTNAELAERLDIKPSSVTAMTKALSSKELIETKTDDHDKRSVRIFLTDKGRTHFQNLGKFQEDYMALLLNGMTAEQRDQFLALLKLVNHGPQEAEYLELFKSYEDKVLGIEKIYAEFEKAKKGCNA
jgi:DNA-binding MarR family transcriptional regulator